MDGVREDIMASFRAALKAVDPASAVRRHLVPTPGGDGLVLHRRGAPPVTFSFGDFRRIFVIGAGKAASPMARAVEEMLGGRIAGGCICVKYGYAERPGRIEVVEAGHPLPDDSGRRAASRIRSIAESAGEGDLVISLISGGGSALLPLPPEGISLDEKVHTTDLLLRSGAGIHEVNAVRKHLSLVKGGNLAAAAYPATVINLMMSDVVGDDEDVIASGPFVPDASSFRDAASVLEKYGIRGLVPQSVNDRIEAGMRGDVPENPRRGDACFDRVSGVIVASNIIALESARAEAQERGYNAVVLSSLIEGDVRDAARFHCAVALEAKQSGNPVAAPAMIISGGETTVAVKGKGLGGRNMEFALHAALFLDGTDGITAASIGTDGTDGPTDAAGAFADGGTVRHASMLGLDAAAFARDNDSYHFFDRTGDLIVTGPTNTNVMDVRIMLVRRGAAGHET